MMGGILSHRQSRPINIRLLYRVRLPVLHAFVDDRPDLSVGLLTYPPLLSPESSLLGSQFALHGAKFSHLLAKLALFSADLPLDCAEFPLQVSKLGLKFSELLLIHRLALVGFQLGHRLVNLRDLLAHVRSRHAGLLLL